MRRWFSIFLLILMPMLSAWSTASAYAVDRAGMDGAHAGHHIEGHDYDAPASSSDDPSADAVQAECDHCHSPGMAPWRFAEGALLAAPDMASHLAEVAPRAPPLSLPERPKWARLA